jgi:large subunit ribosomal protein L15
LNLAVVKRLAGRHREARKRVGRGYGSGLGRQSGRGNKGQKARSSGRTRPGFEGGRMPLFRRLPKRGFTNAPFRVRYTIINIGSLNGFADGETVNLERILEKGLVSADTPLLKVLGEGNLERRLRIEAHRFSKSARAKISAAGGSVRILRRRLRRVAGAAERPGRAGRGGK